PRETHFPQPRLSSPTQTLSASSQVRNNYNCQQPLIPGAFRGQHRLPQPPLGVVRGLDPEDSLEKLISHSLDSRVQHRLSPPPHR
ncbi:MAG: hypothetical protein ACK56F_09545, partial [bacterium]